ncbi:MAG: hypothetical protein MR517_00955 [Bacteroidales bacterium]|nr:hypothetical protein [Bacteroidales bacterium]
MFAACGSDDPVVDNPVEEYVWSTNGGLKACNCLTFNAEGKASADGMQIGNGDAEFVFTGKQTLKRGTYVLKGWVYVAEGAELTIEPGTVIKGDKQTKSSLIVERGGRIIAQGTATAPIVFTSGEVAGERRPGDWGGLILCGRAQNNQGEMQIEGGPRSKHGGQENADNSGVLSYVRIEFAGYPFNTDQEINGLTLGSVGSGTTIDHVQVSYSNDDSFEWFGGSVNCRHLVAYHGWDDDFDTDNGFSGNVQYGLAVRNARIADKSQSNGFESDNNASGSDASPFTTATFSNITFIGPKLQTGEDFQNTTDFINAGNYNPNNGSALGRFQSAMQIRRSSRLNIINSLAAGWPIGLILDGEKGDTPAQAAKGGLHFHHNVMAGMDILGSDANKVYEDVRYDAVAKQVVDASQCSYSSEFFRLESLRNQYFDAASSLRLADALGVGSPYLPQVGSPLLGAASFDGEASEWFEKVDFVGAFGATGNWLEGWTDFDPQHTQY